MDYRVAQGTESVTITTETSMTTSHQSGLNHAVALDNGELAATTICGRPYNQQVEGQVTCQECRKLMVPS